MEIDRRCSQITQQAFVLGKLNLNIDKDPLVCRKLFKDVHNIIKKQNKLYKIRILCIPTDNWNQGDDELLSSVCLYSNLKSCLLKGRILHNGVHSGFESLPTKFTLLTSLTNLDLSFNSFKKIPKHIDSLKFLKVLSLNFNFIGEINFDLIPSSIEEFYCSNNAIEVINGCYKKLKVLQIIDFSSNKLDKLPAKFLCTPKLCELLLQENFIKKFPFSVLDNNSITKINLSHNCLSKFISKFLLF